MHRKGGCRHRTKHQIIWKDDVYRASINKTPHYVVVS